MTTARPLYEFGPFSLDPADCRLFRKGKVVQLSPKVFETLLVLVKNGGRTVLKDELMEQLWPNRVVEESSLSQNIFQLRKALGDPYQQYIETIPKRGYRFAVEVREVRNDERPELLIHRHSQTNLVIEEQEDNGDFITEDSGQSHQQVASLREALLNHNTLERSVLIGSVGLMIALSAAIYIWQVRAFREKPGVRSIAVIPFKPLSSEIDEQLRLGMADALISRLSNLREITVRPTSSVLRYGTENTNTTTIGRELGVDAVVDGAVQRESDRLKVTVKLVRVSDGVTVWAKEFDEQFTDVLAIEDSISRQVTAQILGTISDSTRTLLAKGQTKNVRPMKHM